jgi:Uma2 family endonuclease
MQNAARIIGKRSLDFNTDPPPDIVVEIDLTNASQSKFPIYAALGVPEIWRYDGSQAYFYHLSAEQYVETSHSRAFPFLTSTVLAQFIAQSKTEGQDAALDAARAWVRVHKAPGNG